MCGDAEIGGALKAWKRVRDPATRAPKRFGFATFETIEGAVRCARAIDGRRVSEADAAMTCAANAATRAATTAYLRRAGESALDAEGDARRRREIAKVKIKIYSLLQTMFSRYDYKV